MCVCVFVTVLTQKTCRVKPTPPSQPLMPSCALSILKDAGLSHDGKPNEHDEKARMDAFGVVGSYFRSVSGSAHTSAFPADRGML